MLLFCHFQNRCHLLHDLIVIPTAMGSQTAGAVFDAILKIYEAPPAFVPQRIQRTIAEQTAECLRVRTLMTGKILAFPVLEEIIMTHLQFTPSILLAASRKYCYNILKLPSRDKFRTAPVGNPFAVRFSDG